jgi:hypothetical protein
MASQVIAEKRRREPGAPDVSCSPTLVRTIGQAHQRWNCFRTTFRTTPRYINSKRFWGESPALAVNLYIATLI